MRRYASVPFVAALVLVGLALAAPSSVTAAATTVPPTVSASSWNKYPGGPLESGSTQEVLHSVSCSSSSFCMATGSTSAPNGTLILELNGDLWGSSPSPQLSGSVRLSGVSCVGASFCAAVGLLNSGILVEQWNGSAWSVANAPSPGSTTSAAFNAVSCLSSTDCVAVGSATSPAGTNPLVEDWDGTAWTIATSPGVTGSTNSELEGVTCSAPSFCVAVGDSEQASLTATLVEQWNGTSWTILPSPNGSTVSGASNQLESVSCAGTAFCQAVGTFDDGVNPARTLAQSWKGGAWSVVPSPNVSSTEDDNLASVDCFGPTTCSAVGQSNDPTAGFVPLAAVWDGSSWTAVATTNVAPNNTQTGAQAVSCIANADCTAVGTTNEAGTTSPFVMEAPIARSGYRFVASDGGVFNYGSGAPFLGSMGGTHLNRPIVGMATMPAGDGYDLVASDGGVFTFGSAQFYGSTGSMHLNKPVVGMAFTADGAGYWLVASDGGIFSYGDAQFYGSTGGLTLNKPVVGMAATPDGRGYWLVASDGGIFSYGDAAFFGSTAGVVLNKPVVGMAANSTGAYYLVASDGGVFNFPGCQPRVCQLQTGPVAQFLGSTGGMTLNKPIVGMTGGSSGLYYLAGSDGGVFAFPAGAPFFGSAGSIALNAPIVGIAG